MGKRIPILITAIGIGGYGEQILKALKFDDKDRYFIVGTDAQRYCPNFAAVDANYVLPLASADTYLEHVLELCERYQVRGIFPGCEPELKIFSSQRQLFRDLGIILFISPANIINNCLDKNLSNTLLSDLGFQTPRHVLAPRREELSAIDWLPVVVKPSVGAGGSANCFIAQTLDELLALYDYLIQAAGIENFIIQEYVGRSDEEYTVGVLYDLDGRYINAIAMRRMLSGQLNIRTKVPNRTGNAEYGDHLVISSGVSQGYVGRFPVITEQCRMIAKAIGVAGAVNIQCRLVDGIVKVFEINPRFSGTTSIRAMMGYNEPDLLIRRHILNEPITTNFEYEEGLVLRGLVEQRIDV